MKRRTYSPLASILLSALLVVGVSQTALAQAPSPKKLIPPGAIEVKMRNFSVCFLNAPSAPELFFRTPTGEYAQLKIDTARFGEWNTVPATRTLGIFKQRFVPEVVKIDPITKAKTITPSRFEYDEVQSWTMPEGQGPVRRIYYYDEKGQIGFYETDTRQETHPALQVRVINLLNIRAGVRLGQNKNTISPLRESVVRVDVQPEQPFEFQFVLEQPDGPVVSPQKGLRFYNPQERLTIVFAYFPVMETVPNDITRVARYQPEAVRMLESINALPPQPEPVIVLPKRTNPR